MTTIDNKKEKNVSEKDMKPLHETGTKVMGFHNSLGNNRIIAGNIILVIRSKISSQASLYQTEGISTEFSGLLDEGEILLFDQEIFDKALSAWKEYVQSYARCHELYQDVCKYLMKDKYRKQK